MGSLNLRNTCILFLNTSLKVHADVIAGRQINQALNKIFKNYIGKYVKPPCNSSLATSCAKSVMASSEGKVAALFTEAVSISSEGEVAIDATASTVSLAPNVCVVPGVSAAMRWRVCGSCEWWGECYTSFCSGREADDNDGFVDIMSSITAVGDAESEG